MRRQNQFWSAVNNNPNGILQDLHEQVELKNREKMERQRQERDEILKHYENNDLAVGERNKSRATRADPINRVISTNVNSRMAEPPNHPKVSKITDDYKNDLFSPPSPKYKPEDKKVETERERRLRLKREQRDKENSVAAERASIDANLDTFNNRGSYYNNINNFAEQVMQPPQISPNNNNLIEQKESWTEQRSRRDEVYEKKRQERMRAKSSYEEPTYNEPVARPMRSQDELVSNNNYINNNNFPSRASFQDTYFAQKPSMPQENPPPTSFPSIYSNPNHNFATPSPQIIKQEVSFFDRLGEKQRQKKEFAVHDIPSAAPSHPVRHVNEPKSSNNTFGQKQATDVFSFGLFGGLGENDRQKYRKAADHSNHNSIEDWKQQQQQLQRYNNAAPVNYNQEYMYSPPSQYSPPPPIQQQQPVQRNYQPIQNIPQSAYYNPRPSMAQQQPYYSPPKTVDPKQQFADKVSNERGFFDRFGEEEPQKRHVKIVTEQQYQQQPAMYIVSPPKNLQKASRFEEPALPVAEQRYGGYYQHQQQSAVREVEYPPDDHYQSPQRGVREPAREMMMEQPMLSEPPGKDKQRAFMGALRELTDGRTNSAVKRDREDKLKYGEELKRQMEEKAQKEAELVNERKHSEKMELQKAEQNQKELQKREQPVMNSYNQDFQPKQLEPIEMSPPRKSVERNKRDPNSPSNLNAKMDEPVLDEKQQRLKKQEQLRQELENHKLAKQRAEEEAERFRKERYQKKIEYLAQQRREYEMEMALQKQENQKAEIVDDRPANGVQVPKVEAKVRSPSPPPPVIQEQPKPPQEERVEPVQPEVKAEEPQREEEPTLKMFTPKSKSAKIQRSPQSKDSTEEAHFPTEKLKDFVKEVIMEYNREGIISSKINSVLTPERAASPIQQLAPTPRVEVRSNNPIRSSHLETDTMYLYYTPRTAEPLDNEMPSYDMNRYSRASTSSVATRDTESDNLLSLNEFRLQELSEIQNETDMAKQNAKIADYFALAKSPRRRRSRPISAVEKSLPSESDFILIDE